MRLEGNEIVLFEKKDDCCGCGACMNECRKAAISLLRDDAGFLYPVIDEEKCIRCGLCKQVCSYQNHAIDFTPKMTYIAVTSSHDQLMQSASGGIFAAMATDILDRGGIVFGSAMLKENGCLNPQHISISSKKELYKIQGSKYAQSTIGFTYRETRKYLQSSKQVLFSGTPCQIAGLKGYLAKDYDNLITIDIICHGVPSAELFQDYISSLEGKLHGKILDFKFRDKSKGWGLCGKVIFQTQKGKIKEKIVYSTTSSYYDLFLNAATYRNNCYSCKYASTQRIGDITLGDYWGIDKVHPEVLTKNGGIFNERDGLSCVIINSEKGKAFFETLKSYILWVDSDIKNVARFNGQLNKPSYKNPERDIIMGLYEKLGYPGVEKYYKKKQGIRLYYHILVNYIPKSWRIYIKRTIKKRR